MARYNPEATVIAGKKVWTAEELDTLRRLAATMTTEQVAGEIGRSVFSVQKKATQLRLAFPYRKGGGRNLGRVVRDWTPQERRKLFELAGQVTMRIAAQRLGRSLPAVKEQVRRMSLSWLQGVRTIEDVAEYLGVDRGAVKRHRDRLGQRWRTHSGKDTRRYVARGPSDEEIQAIARSMLEEPRSFPHCSLLRLRAIAEGRE